MSNSNICYISFVLITLVINSINCYSFKRIHDDNDTYVFGLGSDTAKIYDGKRQIIRRLLADSPCPGGSFEECGYSCMTENEASNSNVRTECGSSLCNLEKKKTGDNCCFYETGGCYKYYYYCSCLMF